MSGNLISSETSPKAIEDKSPLDTAKRIEDRCKSLGLRLSSGGRAKAGKPPVSEVASRRSAGNIWIVCSFGLQMTWTESWSCSKTTTTGLVCTKGYPATRPGRKLAAQHLRQLALRITVGKAIATGCLICQSPLEWQFAMYRFAQGNHTQR